MLSSCLISKPINYLKVKSQCILLAVLNFNPKATTNFNFNSVCYNFFFFSPLFATVSPVYQFSRVKVSRVSSMPISTYKL